MNDALQARVLRQIAKIGFWRTALQFAALTILLLASQRGKSQSMAVSPAEPACGFARTKTFRELAPVYPNRTQEPVLAAALSRGFRESFLGRAEVAAKIGKEALLQATSLNDVCAQALSSYLVSSNASDQKLEDRIRSLQTVVKLFESLGSPQAVAFSELRLANMFTRDDKFNAAAEQYKRAQSGFAESGNNFGALYARISAVSAQASPDFAKLEAEAKSFGDPCLQGDLQDRWANTGHRDGNLADAINHGTLADVFYVRCAGSDSDRASVQVNLGRAEREQGRPAAALEHYRIALRLQMRSGQLAYVPETYNAMAIAYEHLNQPQQGILLYKKALALARTLHSPTMVEFLEANLGMRYVQVKQPNLGIPLLTDATKNLSSATLRCVRLEQLGAAYDQIGKHELAIQSLKNSLADCRTIQQNARILQTLDKLSLAELHAHRYDDALRDARENIELLDKTRVRTVPKDAYKQGFLNENEEIYDNAVAALTALQRPAEALETAEKGRARAFLDLLAGHPADAHVPPAPHTFAQYRKDLIDSPANASSLSSNAMLAAIDRLDSTLLAYWLSSDTLYIWVARHGESIVEVSKPISPSRLSALVAASRTANASHTAKVNAWQALYRLLIAPVASALPTTNGDLLTIVPSGPLFAVSFAALESPHGAYLAERYRMHVIPSVGLLNYTKRNAEAASQKPAHYLLFDKPEQMPMDFTQHLLAPLPGTAAEVSAIAKLLPANEVVRLEGSHANAVELRKNLPDATTLHFATHAVLDDADPYKSFLALDDAKHDGRLSLADIYALQLNSRLVVLSACSTGLGKVTGDGVDGMSRAFFYAGSAAVLTTLWDISDRPTADFLPRFYGGLMKGQSPSIALRYAQLSMLADLRHHRVRTRGLSGEVILPPDPAYWAAFSLAGEP